MNKNNLKISFRHLLGNPVNSAINIIGIILALSVVSVILVFILNEVSCNSSFKNRNRIYRILYNDVNHKIWGTTPFVAGKEVSETFSEIEAYAPYLKMDMDISKNNEFIEESDFVCTNNSFFSIFSIKVIHGNYSGLENTDNNLLISKNMALKYFGNDNPVGQILKVRYSGSDISMQIIGVFDDIPGNSVIRASFIAGNKFGFKYLVKNAVYIGNLKPEERDFVESWDYGCFFTNYVLLKDHVSITDVENKLRHLGDIHSTKEYKYKFSIQALKDIYFKSANISDNNKGDSGNFKMLFILASIGIAILVIAIINYLNLTIAQALTQSKGYVLRRIFGAGKFDIVIQMVTESILILAIAWPVAVYSTVACLPLVSNLFGKSYILSVSNQLVWYYVVSLILILLMGGVCGFFVSVKINALNTIEAIKNKRIISVRRFSFRNALIVFQLIVFMILFSVTILVKQQLNYSMNMDIGINKEGLIRFPVGDHNFNLLKQEILKNPNVIDVCGALWLPPHKAKMEITIPAIDEPQREIVVKGLFTDYHFVRTMGLHLLQGTDFDEKTSGNGIIINETAVKALGLKNRIIGQETAMGPIIGVVSDFNMYSIYEKISPIIIGLDPGNCREMAVRVKTSQLYQTIDFMKSVWKSTPGSTAFDYNFTDDILKQFYESDIQLSRIIGIFSAIAIVIACLGLFGLSFQVSRQNTKSVGIRKVNGAKVTLIFYELNKNFIRWIFVAFIVSVPISWWIMQAWLRNFAYKTNISPWIFIISGFMAFVITVLTVCWQTWKAATRNPVEALRYE
jgi:putative ABC transport system permease protein